MKREPSEDTIQIEPKYKLSLEELNRLTNELIADKTKSISEGHRLVTVEVGSDEIYSNVARHIEQNLAFFKEDDLESEFKPYESASRFFISVDRREGKATGVIRVIENSPAGFETPHDLSNPPFNIAEGEWMKQHDITDLDKVWDIASLGVLPEYQNGFVSLQLFRAVYKSAVEVHDIEHFVALIDKNALGKLENFFGVAFQPLAGSTGAPYHHSEWTQPVYGHLPDMYLTANHRMDAPIGKAASRAAEVLVMGANDGSLVLDTEN
ncbi:MAG: hypothetical protein JWN26_362 [Candidatus Saccharibacteria bacterium]|nr:hypothetical protein [Candidatus Saccharibacteria bacterium]